jgi:hypothetical protein
MFVVSAKITPIFTIFMEPGSRTDNPPAQELHTLANLIGTLIAILTLTAPVLTIAHFSSASAGWQPPIQLEQIGE